MAADINYKGYSAGEFIKDEFFQRWVYFPDAENTAFWDNFLRTNPDKADAVDEASRFLRLLNFNEGDVFQSKINALKKRIDFTIDHPQRAAHLEKHSEGHSITRSMAMAWKIAASVALFAMVTYFIGMNSPKEQPQDDTARVTEQTTSKGERTIISLEDGTKVWLNAASTIRYPESFQGEKVREVYLEGEAFFDVTHNESQPFVVRTQAVQIKVLGTSFNVKSYAKEDKIETTLIRGKVTVESMDEQPKIVTLVPNQVATYHKESKKIVLNNETDIEAVAGWKDGKLIFDNQPLSDIVLALERWYDVNITVEHEKSLKCHFSAKIENLSLREVLELFKASDGIDYTIDGRQITIEGTICDN